MIRVFYGEDRKRAKNMADKILGDNYEVIEAENLLPNDMPSLFLGVSLFAETRAILIKDLSLNTDCWAELPKYVSDTTHNIVILETKVDKRSSCYKALSKDKNVEFKEFALAEDPNKKLVFDIFDTAFRGDGKRAIEMCEQIELTNDPFMFMGLMVSQVCKKLQYNNPKAIKAIKIMAQADMDMKSTTVEPWTLIKTALLKIAAC